MVDPKIAALILHLGGEDHGLARRHGLPDAVVQAAVLRQAAHAEALDDQRVVPLQKIVRQPPVHTGNQFQKSHFCVQPIIKYRLRSALLPDIPQQHAVPQNSQVRVVDAGERLEALGAGLFRPGTQDHPAVKHDGDPRQVLRPAAKGVHQIDLGVRGVKADGLLGSGEDNRLWTALD